MTTDWQTMYGYAGKQVKVTLNYEDSNGYVIGRLIYLDVWGEVKIETDDGMHYAWPALEMVLIDEL